MRRHERRSFDGRASGATDGAPNPSPADEAAGGEPRRPDARVLETEAAPETDAAPETGAGGAGSAGVESAPRGPAAAVEASRDDAAGREQLLRLAAEFDNFRKRVARERAETWGRAQAELIEKLLPALDDLRRVAHPPEAGPIEGAAAALLEGVALVERNVLSALGRAGLVEVPAEREAFDPALHEAVFTEPTDDADLDGRVAGVLQPGYRFGDRLLRPARVAVWKLRD
ncbi:MAG TPA: nucleotide exchange factor GrpE [Gemmatimonadota bacterium]|jgi:molecular chaperone GrpE